RGAAPGRMRTKGNSASKRLAGPNFDSFTSTTRPQASRRRVDSGTPMYFASCSRSAGLLLSGLAEPNRIAAPAGVGVRTRRDTEGNGGAGRRGRLDGERHERVLQGDDAGPFDGQTAPALDEVGLRLRLGPRPVEDLDGLRLLFAAVGQHLPGLPAEPPRGRLR